MVNSLPNDCYRSGATSSSESKPNKSAERKKPERANKITKTWKNKAKAWCNLVRLERIFSKTSYILAFRKCWHCHGIFFQHTWQHQKPTTSKAREYVLLSRTLKIGANRLQWKLLWDAQCIRKRQIKGRWLKGWNCHQNKEYSLQSYMVDNHLVYRCEPYCKRIKANGRQVVKPFPQERQ